MSKTTKVIINLLGALVFINLGWFGNNLYKNYITQDLRLPEWQKPKPLEKYEIENLSKADIKPADIKIEKELQKGDGFTSYLISFSFDPMLSGKEEKKVTGLLNVPLQAPDTAGKPDSYPLVILFRGYVDQSIYQTGIGTKRVGEYFAKNGYITIAPDFLGYAGSSSEAGDIFESRFQTYTTALTLLKSIQVVPGFTTDPQTFRVDQSNIFIWAHSNGGQIALTSLEASGVSYPTVLWAPVTKPFPYSILYYTDESQDNGKFIRHELAKFENDYDVDKFSLTSYLDRVNAPIEFHQGTADDAVPVAWSDLFVKKMKNLNKNITYIVHPGADHNMNPLWDDAIDQSLDFFNSKKTPRR